VDVHFPFPEQTFGLDETNPKHVREGDNFGDILGDDFGDSLGDGFGEDFGDNLGEVFGEGFGEFTGDAV
jgi:hypothetical protein